MNAALVFIQLPMGSDGGDEIAIDPREIAALRSHVVTSYSYVDYTLVVLKNGKEFDCRIKKADVEERIRRALTAVGVAEV